MPYARVCLCWQHNDSKVKDQSTRVRMFNARTRLIHRARIAAGIKFAKDTGPFPHDIDTAPMLRTLIPFTLTGARMVAWTSPWTERYLDILPALEFCRSIQTTLIRHPMYARRAGWDQGVNALVDIRNWPGEATTTMPVFEWKL